MADAVPVEDVNEETPVKDSVISTDCNKLDPDAEVDVKTGVFLSPGKEPEKILLLRNEKVIFVDHVQNRTVQHGNWHKWQKKDGTQMLSITFHCNGSDLDEELTQHLFRSLIPGVYRMQDGMQVVVLHEEYENGVGGEPLYLNIEKAKLQYEIKHMYLWLHPQRAPAVLFVTKEKLEIVYHGFEVKGSKRQKTCTSAPNGNFDYVFDDNTGTDTITTCYNWQGSPTTQTTSLCRTPASHPVFRANGDGVRKYPAHKLTKWHIISVELQENKNVFFSDTK